ncbi:peptidase dimerization domain-containing protein [Parasutterella excrementihominis]|nr:peptidase dimerization domain-containing protein [Parasutterella sp.]MCI9302349.1 peptidase dimerization domain-containing protein [Parasutterella excrementihominis]RHU69410.1 peptidase M20 [Burkholderiales bacterium]MTT66902.1 peptidase dimerization domain-containing protein [Parasutterella excrementihominis]MTT74244.1 peptidase dimerization domain-containing protein [Parasutterella excrementihominis]
MLPTERLFRRWFLPKAIARLKSCTNKGADMNKLLAALVCAFAASAVSAATYEVFITGPGGHSNGSYGNTNAVHAGSRAVLELEKALPCAVITDFKGGATVNAIAGDAAFKVNTAMCKTPEVDNKALIEKAIKAGVDKENAFRGVKAGDLVKGFPAEIQFKIK